MYSNKNSEIDKDSKTVLMRVCVPENEKVCATERVCVCVYKRGENVCDMKRDEEEVCVCVCMCLCV